MTQFILALVAEDTLHVGELLPLQVVQCHAAPRRHRAPVQPGSGLGLPHLGRQPLQQRLGRAPGLGLEHDLAGLGLAPDPAVEDRS